MPRSFSVQSAQKPKTYDDPAATSSVRDLSAQLPYIFSTSRFAHYLKVMMRDKIGGYTSRGEAEAFLNRWIQNYVAPTNANAAMKSKHPLSEAQNRCHGSSRASLGCIAQSRS